MNHKAVGAVTGTDLEQVLYERSKMIEKAVVAQTKINYQVEVVTDASNAFLDRAQVKYKTVKSEHFVLHGDHEVAMLKEALVWAERAIRIMQVAFPKDGGFNSDPARWLRESAHFIAKDTYKQVLKANASLVQDLEWKLEHTTTSGIFSEDGALALAASANRQGLFDSVVRRVAQSYSGFGSDGLREGIGHTFVGMIFNNNRLFGVDLKKQQGTRASEEDREYTSPNFDVWKDLALEQAWKISGGVKASMLPLVKTAAFTNQQRIKAWSFCDYMMRRDPKMLQAMDRLQTMKNPWDVEAAFKKAHSVTIPQLDKEWEDFWTGASPVMKAIKRNTPPLAAMSKGVKKWLKVLNEFRKSQNSNPVNFSANYSARCHDHAKYLLANKSERDVDAVQQQKPELEGGTHLGNMFSQMALVATKASPGGAKKMFQKWMDLPGYRDALINNCILTIGLYSEGGVLVINAVSGLGTPKTNKGYKFYPRQKTVPAEIKVSRLGSEVRKKLEERGHGKAKVIGYPLTLHFGTGIGGNRSSYKCVVTSARGETAARNVRDGRWAQSAHQCTWRCDLLSVQAAAEGSAHHGLELGDGRRGEAPRDSVHSAVVSAVALAMERGARSVSYRVRQ